MNILVTGGAGYIGSHTCKALADAGHKPIVIDNMSYGHEWAVQWGPLHKTDILDQKKVEEILKSEKIEAVIHFAAFTYVGESVQNPLKYYHNNVIGTLSVLGAMKNANVSKIVFSSTCAVYGIPARGPLEENFPKNPISPYGQSKLISEKILEDFGKAFGIKSVCLRYFNAAGADASGKIGEDHDPETHLIPLTLQAAFFPERGLVVMGEDYPTNDGTCIRDYIHVTDLASAHVKALEYLESTKHLQSAFNIGTGFGVSVKEVIEITEKILKRKVSFRTGERREGDPPELVAKSSKAQKDLNWTADHSRIENIISTAANWYQKHHV